MKQNPLRGWFANPRGWWVAARPSDTKDRRNFYMDSGLAMEVWLDNDCEYDLVYCSRKTMVKNSDRHNRHVEKYREKCERYRTALAEVSNST